MKTFVTYLKLFICGIIVNITNLLPRNRKMMIFGAWFGQKYDDNTKALFEYVINNRKDIEAYWITANKEVYSQMKEKGLPVYLNTSFKAKYLSLRSRYYLSVVMLDGRDSGGNLARYMGGIHVINLWHGVPIKKIMFDDEAQRTLMNSNKAKFIHFFEKRPFRHTYHFATSPNIVEIYKRCFRSDDEHVLNMGQARNDYFYEQRHNPYRDRFNNKRIILYMPTHRKAGNLTMDMNVLLNLDKIDKICAMNNAVFLIKKHFYHSKEKSIVGNYNNIKEITNENPSAQVLLDAADILITDYSGCFIDFLLLDRPILFYCYDLDEYLLNDRNMYIDYRSTIPGEICEDKEALNTSLEVLLKGEDLFVNKRKEQRDFFYSKDNQKPVSKKQIEAILKL